MSSFYNPSNQYTYTSFLDVLINKINCHPVKENILLFFQYFPPKTALKKLDIIH